jgi:hypothetical protein
MRRVAAFAIACLLGGLVTGAVSGAAPNAAHKPPAAQMVDGACAKLAKLRNAHSYPPDRQWVWVIPTGCVFTRDRPQPTRCTSDRDLGCIATPDVHVRFQRKEYVFHLTMKGSPANALGLARAGTQLVVAHDGRGSKARQTLIVDFRGTEFDGIIPANAQHGLSPDFGPLLHWRIRYTLDRRKGLCCPRFDPGNPTFSPYQVAPERLSAVPPAG